MSFVIWGEGGEANTCVLASLQGYDDAWKLSRGLPLAGEFPSSAYFPMDPDFPKKVRLSDYLMNIEDAIVVSKRVKEFLASREPKDVEFLQVTIKNHKGRVASEDYYIVNPYGSQDCLDVAASNVKYSRIDKSMIKSMDRMVIDASRVDPDVSLFRVSNVYGPVLVRKTLADELEAEEFNALLWVDPADYRG